MSTRRQIPRGDENLICPLHQKPMADVCHKCPWWVEVKGSDPQTGESIDHWNCSIAWLPLLTIDTARQARAGAAATESFRNEMVALNGPKGVVPGNGHHGGLVEEARRRLGWAG